jgi:hypothetical protein
MTVKKSPSEEELMEQFIKLLKADKAKIPNIVRYIERILMDSMQLGEQGYQPTFAFTIFAKQVDNRLELTFRPVRTSDTNTYETFQLEKLGEFVNKAINEYGKQVWGFTPIDERTVESIDPAAIKCWEGILKDVNENRAD